MKKLVFAIISAIAFSGAAAAQNVGGDYVSTGTNLDGSPYKGSARITFISDATCKIVWDGSEGICMRAANIVTAAYKFNKGGDVGLVTYIVREDGTLDGRWTVTGMNGIGTEILRPRR